MKKYKIVLIDIDDTLFDYKKAENSAMKKVFEDFGYFEKNTLKNYENLRMDYKEINNFLWEELERGNITSDKLKVERFRQLFEKNNLDYNAKDFSNGYLKRLGEGVFLFDGVVNFCKYISEKYKVAIITNGLKEVQYPRIEKSGIGNFIDEIVISEEVGFAKPDKKIFEIAIEKLEKISNQKYGKDEIIMIGDSQTADIQGGINIGIDTCWVNIVGKVERENIKPTYKVTSIKELYEIV